MHTAWISFTFCIRSSFEVHLVMRVSAYLNTFKGICGLTSKAQLFSVHKFNFQRPPKFATSNFTTSVNKSNIVVFDIDETLCFGIHASSSDTSAGDIEYSYRNPECEIVQMRYPDTNSWYVFRPHFDVLLKYLLKHNTRLAFFSAGIESRNVPLIEDILKRSLSPETYHKHLAEGQFKVLSRHHMRRIIPGKEKGVTVFSDGDLVKDLTPALRTGETSADAVLIDDNPTYCAHDQLMCVYTPGSMLELSETQLRVGELRVKNNFYYFLGLFHTVFAHQQKHQQSLRQALTEVVQLHGSYHSQYCVPSLRFELDMTLLGLAETRKTCPEAVFYGAETFLAEEPGLHPAQFYHDYAVADSLLDALLEGRRSMTEATMFMFMRQLAEETLDHHETTGQGTSLREKYDQVVHISKQKGGISDQ